QLVFQPIPIDELMIEGRSRWSARLQRSGFYERAGQGIGYQIDRPAIRAHNVVLLSELLARIPRRPQFRGFIDPAPAVEDVDFTEPLPIECAPGIYVDGTPWAGFVDDLPLEWVEGLEFYTSPVQVPIQYLGAGAFCGLLLIWTG